MISLGSDSHFRVLEKRQQASELNLINALSALAKSIPSSSARGAITDAMRVNVKWPNGSTAAMLFHRQSFPQVRGAPRNFAYFNFDGCDFYGAMLNHVNLCGSRFVSADLRFTTLFECDLSHSDLSFSHLIGSLMSFGNFEFANFSKAQLKAADAANAVFLGANFKGAKLDGLDIDGANLKTARHLTKEQIMSTRVSRYTELDAVLGFLERTARCGFGGYTAG